MHPDSGDANRLPMRIHHVHRKKNNFFHNDISLHPLRAGSRQ